MKGILVLVVVLCIYVGVIESGCNGKEPQACKRILEEINERRAYRLDCDNRLTRAAGEHAEDMAAHDFLSHVGSDASTPASRAHYAGYQWLAIAEALASGQETWGKVFGEWKHTNNVADLMTDENLHDFGCGVANDANGRPFWVALFGREGDKYSYSKCAHTRTCHNNTASVVGTSFWEEAW